MDTPGKSSTTFCTVQKNVFVLMSRVRVCGLYLLTAAKSGNLEYLLKNAFSVHWITVVSD